MLRDEYISLFDKLKEGDINENVRHLKYKFESFSKLAIEQLKEKSATNEMLLEDLKGLQSSLQLGEVGGSMVMKEEPSSPPVEYQQLEPQTSMSMINSSCVVLLAGMYPTQLLLLNLKSNKNLWMKMYCHQNIFSLVSLQSL